MRVHFGKSVRAQPGLGDAAAQAVAQDGPELGQNPRSRRQGQGVLAGPGEPVTRKEVPAMPGNADPAPEVLPGQEAPGRPQPLTMAG